MAAPFLDGLELVARALHEAGVRYLTVGGIAVIAHGHARSTVDLDLVVDFEERNLTAALRALEGLGYRPRIPVPLEAFADATQRETWAREKHLVVFALFHPNPGHPLVDLFAAPPFDVPLELRRSVSFRVGGGAWLPVVALDALIAMKERVGRPQDLADVAALRALASREGDVERGAIGGAGDEPLRAERGEP